MILFKSCPRCGGDVDAAVQDDVYCVQCAYRPTVTAFNRRVPRNQGHPSAASWSGNEGEALREGGSALCPRCDSDEVISLEKLRVRDNTCYRCRKCGHIFSPRIEEPRGYTDAALP